MFGGGGIYSFSEASGLLPIAPVNGWIGQFYDQVASRIGLGAAGGAGKLMGLAPYGNPVYVTEKLVGTWHEVSMGGRITLGAVLDLWLSDTVGVREIPAWDKNCEVPPKFIADIAASAPDGVISPEGWL